MSASKLVWVALAGIWAVPHSAALAASTAPAPVSATAPAAPAAPKAPAAVASVAPAAPIASKASAALAQCGLASWYRGGGRTATGETHRAGDLTAAHRTLPFGTKVRVRNQRTGKEVIVRINDRGPFIQKRVIDLSQGASRVLGMGGLAPVCITVLKDEPKAPVATASVVPPVPAASPKPTASSASPALADGGGWETKIVRSRELQASATQPFKPID